MLTKISTGRTYERSGGYRVTVEKVDAQYVYGINQEGRTSRTRREDFAKRYVLSDAPPEPHQLDDDAPLAVAEVARLAGCTSYYVHRAVRLGEISGRLLGKEWALNAPSARRWAQQRVAEAPAAPALLFAAPADTEAPAAVCDCLPVLLAIRQETEKLTEAVRELVVAFA